MANDTKIERFIEKYVPGIGVLRAIGPTVPTDGNEGYSPGCIFQKTDGSATTCIYINRGSLTSCDFRTVVDGRSPFTAAGRGLSPLIWDNCPQLDYIINPQMGSYFFDDFHDGIDIATNLAVAVVSALGTTGKWTGFTGVTANTVATLATNIHGEISMSTDTDNQGVKLIYPKGGAIAGKFKFTAGKKFWMEARVKVSSIADTISQIFVGFAEEGLVTEGTLLLINEAGLADKDYVGFVREYADGNQFNIAWNTESGGASPVSDGNAVTLAATTWKKIGLYCDGTTLYFFADGVLLAYSVLIAATDFPIDEEMAFYMENLCGAAGTANTLNADWVAIAQEY